MSNVVNKYLYKYLLSFIKYIPIILSIALLINLICLYCGVSIPLLAHIFGISMMFILLLYLLSFVFKFCALYRLPLHYITLNNLISCLYKYGILAISSISVYRLMFIITGIAVVIYVWLMYKNRNNPKVDPIKQLCENYCDCNC